MTDLLVLSEAGVRRILTPDRFDELAAAIEQAPVALSGGSASVPPRIAARSAAGLLGAMPGYVPGLGLVAKLVTVFKSSGHAVEDVAAAAVVLRYATASG